MNRSPIISLPLIDVKTIFLQESVRQYLISGTLKEVIGQFLTLQREREKERERHFHSAERFIRSLNFIYLLFVKLIKASVEMICYHIQNLYSFHF